MDQCHPAGWLGIWPLANNSPPTLDVPPQWGPGRPGGVIIGEGLTIDCSWLHFGKENFSICKGATHL